jgi:hypothetical protein
MVCETNISTASVFARKFAPKRIYQDWGLFSDPGCQRVVTHGRLCSWPDGESIPPPPTATPPQYGRDMNPPGFNQFVELKERHTVWDTLRKHWRDVCRSNPGHST